MLILTRKPGESLYIGDEIKITIVELKGHQIRVGITAPTEMRIYREEIYQQILEENRMAAEASQSADVGLEGLSAAWADGGGSGGSGGDEEEGKKSAPSSGIKPASLSARPLQGKDLGSGSPAFAVPKGVDLAKGKGHEPEVVVKRKRIKKSDE